MTAAWSEQAGNTLLAAMMAVMVLADGVLAWLGAMAWQGHRNGMLTVGQAGPFAVMGVSAAVGALFALLAMIALLRGGRGHALARGTLNLTWLRLGAVLVALVIVVLTVGVSAMGILGMVLAVGDALAGFIVTGVAARRTRDG